MLNSHSFNSRAALIDNLLYDPYFSGSSFHAMLCVPVSLLSAAGGKPDKWEQSQETSSPADFPGSGGVNGSSGHLRGQEVLWVGYTFKNKEITPVDVASEGACASLDDIMGLFAVRLMKLE